MLCTCEASSLGILIEGPPASKLASLIPSSLRTKLVRKLSFRGGQNNGNTPSSTQTSATRATGAGRKGVAEHYRQLDSESSFVLGLQRQLSISSVRDAAAELQAMTPGATSTLHSHRFVTTSNLLTSPSVVPRGSGANGFASYPSSGNLPAASSRSSASAYGSTASLASFVSTTNVMMNSTLFEALSSAAPNFALPAPRRTLVPPAQSAARAQQTAATISRSHRCSSLRSLAGDEAGQFCPPDDLLFQVPRSTELKASSQTRGPPPTPPPRSHPPGTLSQAQAHSQQTLATTGRYSMAVPASPLNKGITGMSMPAASSRARPSSYFAPPSAGEPFATPTAPTALSTTSSKQSATKRSSKKSALH